MYDVSKLRSVEECRRVMARALAKNEIDIYQAVFRRSCELVANENDDPNDPMVREFFLTLAAYEQLLTEKNGRTTAAARTRQKIKNKGVKQSLIDWTLQKAETSGFRWLLEKGLSDHTAEYIVAKYSNRFPEEVVRLAKARLVEHGIQLPT
jgi:hypothetical protein